MADVMYLQEKYINSTLSIDEMREFLEYLEGNEDAPYRESRMQKLKRLIKEHDRRITAQQQDSELHYEAAVKYSELTKKWEQYGAYWKPLGSSITKWYYGDSCFFTWYSGVDSIDHLKSAYEADKEFERLLKLNSNHVLSNEM